MASKHPEDPPPSYDDCKFSVNGDLAANNDAIVEALDDLEVKIEKLRIEASELEEARIELTSALTMIDTKFNSTHLSAGHREEIYATLRRLMDRLLTVTINVVIPRTPEQLDAYKSVEKMMDKLREDIGSGMFKCQAQLESYINACSAEPTGPADGKFQSTIIACALEDQKAVKKTLRSWLTMIKSVSQELKAKLSSKSKTLPK